MYVMIDNYDSFVYNLSSYFLEFGRDILVRRCDALSIKEIEEMSPQGIVISPGPGRPEEAVLSMEAVDSFKGRIPILGVCLGHQVIGKAFGAGIHKGKRPMHGKVTNTYHAGRGLFKGLPDGIEVTRYHSLVVEEKGLPECLRVDARAGDGAVMAVTHREYPIYGVQFHPEAVLSQWGHELLKNFDNICRDWRDGHAPDKRA